MKCFYHNEIDSIGICKSCHKGICLNCYQDFGNGIACRNTCIEDAISITQAQKAKIKPSYGPSFVYIISGVILARYGHTSYFDLILHFGILFFVFGIYSLISIFIQRKN